MEEKDKKYFVYIHTNKINNKKYVGQTCRDKPEYRWNKNGSGYYRQPYFYNEILEYGWDNFDTEIIESNLTLEEANVLEKALIKKFDTTNKDKGYNTQAGGSGGDQKHVNKLKMLESEILKEELAIFKIVEEKIKKRLANIEINDNEFVPIKDKYLLNLDEFCKYISISETKAREILHRPNTFSLRIGNRLYVNKKKFEEYIDYCTDNKIDIK